MNLQNIDCRYLKVNSSAYASGFNIGTLKEVTIIAKVNNEPSIREEIVTDIENVWSVDYTIYNNTVIKQVYVRNILNNLTYPLLQSSSLPQNLEADIAVGFVPFGVFPIQTITNETYTVTNLPYYLVMDRMVIGDNVSEKSFYFGNILHNKYIFASDGILLTPAFFGKSVLPDGIYNVEVMVTYTNLTVTSEQICFFYDCVLKQHLIDKLGLDVCKEEDVHLLMLHYSLTQVSNEHCDCDDMYRVFDYLNKAITSKQEPCGC